MRIAVMGLTLGLMIFFPNSKALAQTTRFRGYVAVAETLDQRILDGSGSFDFYRYFKGIPPNSVGLMLELLGNYGLSKGDNDFQNGQPNAVNMLLWNLVLHSFAEEIQAGCSGTLTLPVNMQFKTALEAICKWPADSAKTEESLRGLWLALMSYDAPMEEYVAWRDFFLHSTFATKPASEVVSSMVFSIAYNPYFLLKH